MAIEKYTIQIFFVSPKNDVHQNVSYDFPTENDVMTIGHLLASGYQAQYGNDENAYLSISYYAYDSEFGPMRYHDIYEGWLNQL